MPKKLHSSFWVLIFVPIYIFLRIDAQAQSDDSPLIYYYSQEDASFIIETAEGANREILADFALREHRQIAGPGWSPSGQWFAWFESSQGAVPSNGYVTPRGSEDYMSIFDSEGVIEMHWSPLDDLLLASRIVYDEMGAQQTEIVVIDFAADQRILLRETHTQGQLLSLGWLPQGQGIFIADTSGHIRIIWLPEHNETTIKSSTGIDSPISFSPASYLLHQGTDQSLIVSDVSDMNLETVFQSDIDGRIKKVYWSHGGLQAVIYTDSCAGNCGDIWYLDIQTRTFHLVAEDAPWLLSPRTTDSRFFYEPVWSPSDTYFAYITTDHALEVVELLTSQSGRVDITQEGDIERFWWLSESEIVFEWSTDEWNKDRFYTVSAESWLKPEEHQVVRMTVQYNFNSAQVPTLSTESRQMVFSTADCADVCILDLISGTVVASFELVGRQDVSYFVREYVWNPDNEWFFILSDYRGVRLVHVANISGTVQRQLGVCALSLSCFGWLPENAD